MSQNSIITISFLSLFAIIFVFAFKVDGNQQDDFCMNQSYNFYAKTFMSQDGRIIDYDKNGITTSEGQSYMMMQSVIINNRANFDLAYKWAKNNLRRQDKLFAWLWGKSPTGDYKILDDNSASDADCDIAFSLLLAYERWKDFRYLEEALCIINSIWANETKQVSGDLVLMPGAKQALEEKIELNPSYFSPYAFKFFQKYDELHNWNLLVDSSYSYLEKSMAATKTGLPPNWFLIENSKVVLENSERSDFSYDAIRVFARTYMDYVRTKDPRALKTLEATKFFIPKWEESGRFYTNYKADGTLRDKNEFLGSISILTPVINLYNKEVAREIHEKKLDSIINNKSFWTSKKEYYAKNLIWFGCYFYNPNSTEYKKMGKLGRSLKNKSF